MRWSPLLLLPLLPMRVDAAQMALSPCALQALSSTVVLGEVARREVRWIPGGEGGIETVVDVWIAATWKGGSGSEWAEVMLPGGEIDGFGFVVEDVPTLRTGRWYVLFLLPAPQGGWSVVGGEQGAVPVRRGGDSSEDPALRRLLETLGSCNG